MSAFITPTSTSSKKKNTFLKALRSIGKSLRRKTEKSPKASNGLDIVSKMPDAPTTNAADIIRNEEKAIVRLRHTLAKDTAKPSSKTQKKHSSSPKLATNTYEPKNDAKLRTQIKIQEILKNIGLNENTTDTTVLEQKLNELPPVPWQYIKLPSQLDLEEEVGNIPFTPYISEEDKRKKRGGKKGRKTKKARSSRKISVA